MNSSMTAYNRRNSWSPVQELKQEMDRLFETAWNDRSDAWTHTRSWQPSCDLSEDKDHYLISLEMAGIPKEQVKIEVAENQLVVSGERKFEDQKKEYGVTYTERKYGKFQRSFTLPSGLDTEKIEANCQDGVLRIFIPKSETAKPRQIRIGSGSSTSFFGKLIGQPSSKEKEVDHSYSDKPSGKNAS